MSTSKLAFRAVCFVAIFFLGVTSLLQTIANQSSLENAAMKASIYGQSRRPEFQQEQSRIRQPSIAVNDTAVTDASSEAVALVEDKSEEKSEAPSEDKNEDKHETPVEDKSNENDAAAGRQPSITVNDTFVAETIYRSKTKDESPVSEGGNDDLVLEPKDYILSKGWDTSPIVVEKYKLIFFSVPKVGCTVWKQLFRRMGGVLISDTDKLFSNHNPKINALTYLRDIYERPNGTAIVKDMLTNPAWTKAMFVRDPKERFLSAYLDKALRDEGSYIKRFLCNSESRRAILTEALGIDLTDPERCLEHARASFANFLKVAHAVRPDDTHWLPHSKRMEPKYWMVMERAHKNGSFFVGQMDTSEEDAKALLMKIGGDAWEKYGSTGWGENRECPIFSSIAKQKVWHRTSAGEKLAKYYSAETAKLVDEYYAEDYSIPMLGLKPSTIEFQKQR